MCCRSQRATCVRAGWAAALGAAAAVHWTDEVCCSDDTESSCLPNVIAGSPQGYELPDAPYLRPLLSQAAESDKPSTDVVLLILTCGCHLCWQGGRRRGLGANEQRWRGGADVGHRVLGPWWTRRRRRQGHSSTQDCRPEQWVHGHVRLQQGHGARELNF